MKKIYFCFFIFLAGCNSFDSQLPYKPILMPELPKGSPEYTQGWKDGCETGMAAYGSDVYKAIYKWKRTPEYERNERYLKAWKDSYNYCRQYTQTWVKPVFTPENLVPTDTYDSKDPLFGNDAVGNFFYLNSDSDADHGDGGGGDSE